MNHFNKKHGIRNNKSGNIGLIYMVFDTFLFVIPYYLFLIILHFSDSYLCIKVSFYEGEPARIDQSDRNKMRMNKLL